MNKEALFIINSPFQCLCMFEALKYYSIKNYDVVFKPDCVERNNIMVNQFLTEHGITYKTQSMSHLSILIPHIFRNKNRYSFLFNGDYYGGGVTAYLYSLLYAKKKAKVVYMDDGTQSLEVFATPPVPRFVSKRQALFVHTFEILKWLKQIGKPHYFTIFDVISDNFEVDRNTLSLLREQVANIQPKGIYIIGTNFNDPCIDEVGSMDILRKKVKDLKNRYPQESIYYCPHRRNMDNGELFSYLESEHVELFNTKVSVEQDFVNKGIYPKYVAGFGSTALFTLKIIYDRAEVEDVKLYLSSNKGWATGAYFDMFDDQCKSIGIKSVDYSK